MCDISQTYVSFSPAFAGAIQQKDSDLSIVADAVFEGNSAAFGGREAAAVQHVATSISQPRSRYRFEPNL